MKEIKNKKVGMIRKGAAIPFIIVVVIIVVFNIFFLDRVVKSTIEIVGAKVNGAQVDVGSVESSFMNLSVVVQNVEFTDAKNPELNLFTVGKIRFQMMWDALLRAKIVIDESSVEDITLGTKRKSPGKAFPKEVKKESEKDSGISKEVLSNAKKEFEGNVFGDISALLSGTSSKDLAKSIEGELKSKKYYEDLEKTIDQKEIELKKMFEALPKEKEISQYDDRIKAIDWNGLKDFKKAPKILKEANNLKKEISSTIKQYEQAATRVKSEVEFGSESIKKAQSVVNEDLKALESKMSIPTLDAQTIAKVIFGAQFADYITTLSEYFEKAKEYMPPKKEKKVVASKPVRGTGRNYQFGTPNSYPLFWLKRSKISSDNEQGQIIGELLDLTTDQNVANKTTVFSLSGDFPPKEIRKMSALISLDHRNEVKDVLKVSFGSLPVSDKSLSNSEGVKFAMKKANLSSDLVATVTGSNVSISVANRFSKIDYDIAAKSKLIEELLKNVANDTKIVTLDASAKGSFEKLNFKIRTNLADTIKQSLGKQLQAKIEEAKKKLRVGLDEKLAGNKKSVEDKLDKLKNKYLGALEKNKGALSGLENTLKKNGSMPKLKNPLDSLKKKFKF